MGLNSDKTSKFFCINVIYRMMPFPITLSDPNLDFKVTIFYTVK